MRNPSHVTRSIVPVAVVALAGALAACSSSEEPAPQPAPQTVTETVAESPAAADTQAESPAESPAAAAGGDTELRVVLDGRDISGDFRPTRCEYGEDDGVPDVELEADRTAGDGELEVEIDLTDPPRLVDYSVDEAADREWEAEDAQEQAARVTVDGDTYTVVGDVTLDDSREVVPLEVSFTCPR